MRWPPHAGTRPQSDTVNLSLASAGIYSHEEGGVEVRRLCFGLGGGGQWVGLWLGRRRDQDLALMQALILFPGIPGQSTSPGEYFPLCPGPSLNQPQTFDGYSVPLRRCLLNLQ